MIVYSIGYIGRAATANRYYFFAFLMTGSLIGVDDGARARQLLRLLGADDLDVLLPGHPRTDPQGAARRPRLFPDVRGGRLRDAFRHPARRTPQIGSFEFAAIADKAGVVAAARRRGDRRLLLRRLRGEDGPGSVAELAAARPPGSALVDLRPAVGHPHQGRPVRHGEGALRRVRRRRAGALRGPRRRRQRRARWRSAASP